MVVRQTPFLAYSDPVGDALGEGYIMAFTSGWLQLSPSTPVGLKNPRRVAM